MVHYYLQVLNGLVIMACIRILGGKLNALAAYNRSDSPWASRILTRTTLYLQSSNTLLSLIDLIPTNKTTQLFRLVQIDPSPAFVL